MGQVVFFFFEGEESYFGWEFPCDAHVAVSLLRSQMLAANVIRRRHILCQAGSSCRKFLSPAEERLEWAFFSVKVRPGPCRDSPVA